MINIPRWVKGGLTAWAVTAGIALFLWLFGFLPLLILLFLAIIFALGVSIAAW